MDYLTIAFIVVICYVLYYYFKRNLNYFEELGIPYVPGWPIFGNMIGPFFRLQHLSDLLCNIYNVNSKAKYVGAFDFTRPVIVLRDLELIKSVTIKNFEHFADHRPFFDEKIDPIFAGNLFNLRGEKWKEMRNLLTPTFTSSKMKMMFELMVNCGENFVNYVSGLSKEANKMVDTKDLFTKYTNDVIATCAFGLEVNSLKDPNNKFYVIGKDASNFDGLRTLKFFLSRSAPIICKIFNLKFVSEEVSNFFINIVNTAVTTRDKKGIRRPDMLQLLMDARNKSFDNIKLDLTTMTAQAFVFFIAGFDGTARYMSIICHELAINPDIQRKLQEEIDGIMKDTNGKPTYDAINNMVYLDAILNEAMRRHPLGGFLDRQCTKAFELPPALPGGKPYLVEPGMNIWIPVPAIQWDPNYYENPMKFDPDRYYQKKVTINDAFNLGFGIGPRSCIGNRFAILEAKVVIFFLMSKFNVKPNAKTCNPIIYSKKNFSIIPIGGFSLDIEPRY